MMMRCLLTACLFVCLAVGCAGSKEIAPTTEEGAKIDQKELDEQMKKSMEMMQKNASPEMKAQMERYKQSQGQNTGR